MESECKEQSDRRQSSESRAVSSNAQRGLTGNKEAALGQHNKSRVDSRRRFGRETGYFDCGHLQL